MFTVKINCRQNVFRRNKLAACDLTLLCHMPTCDITSPNLLAECLPSKLTAGRMFFVEINCPHVIERYYVTCRHDITSPNLLAECLPSKLTAGRMFFVEINLPHVM